MKTKTDQRLVGARLEKQRGSVSRASIQSYEKVLRDAGVAPEDLALLRDLAAANADELEQHEDHLRPSRVLI